MNRRVKKEEELVVNKLDTPAEFAGPVSNRYALSECAFPAENQK